MKKSAPTAFDLDGISPSTTISVGRESSARSTPGSGVPAWRKSARNLMSLWIGMSCLGLIFCAAPARAVETASFEIVARDGRLYPERLEVPAGVRLRLTLRNEGKAPVEFENLELRVEKVLAPDGAAVVHVQALKPGSYTLIDEFHADTGKMLLIAK